MTPYILVFGGSRRPQNNTDKALALALDELGMGDFEINRIHLGEFDLPLPGQPSDSKDPDMLKQLVTEAAGILIATPEYHGSISSTLKLAIDNLGYPSTFEGKTIAIFGVAMGPSADNALAHLRQILTHIGGEVLPGQASIGSVHNVFDEDGRCVDEAAEAEVRGVAAQLLEHLKNSS
ncbi:MAG: NAD(P)H-dependent oxidoreductase [Nitrospinae bacterium]|nr:NAD(P)H-dependent oxidoreductase [Nitrospinota bacterium]